MPLKEEFRTTGEWMFRHRSYLPLLILVPMPFAVYFSVRPISAHFGGLASDIFFIAISVLGLLVRCAIVGFTPKGTSGRNTKRQVAESLNTAGIYAYVRHPLYVGNFLIFMGIVAAVESLWFFVFSFLTYWLYYERIMYAEEEFLRDKFKADFVEWAERTPAIIPKLGGWKQPPLEFSLRNVLKREYSAFYLIVVSFFILATVERLIAGSSWFSPGWIVFLAAGTAIYVMLLMLKKKTKLLFVEGR
ncbi:MAG: isoprenylcysteine carboxylmethyltransferase family protein [Deltaproteobacteria bacterium]|nr:isoprenylcysteine carboxylmethyltransferase family protein [Deltaproteobacteria bacterium]